MQNTWMQLFLGTDITLALSVTKMDIYDLYLAIWSNLNVNSLSKTLTVWPYRDSCGVTEHDFTTCSVNKEFHEVSSMDTCDQSGRSHAERAGSRGIHILWQPGLDRRWKEVYAVPGPSE